MVDAMRGLFIANFTKPVQDRPTLFFEIIQRMEPRFWRRNFKAYLNPSKRQELRGTL
jgi:4-hydroxyphenylpyruvate dioxygenase